MPIRSAFRYFYDHDGFFLAAGLSFYVVIGVVETVVTFPRRRRESREAAQVAPVERSSIPPT